MREGRILADDTPQGVLAATGTDDVEQAFLILVDRARDERDPEKVSA
jgi:ABC-2 type transport system ATP-binding protein